MISRCCLNPGQNYFLQKKCVIVKSAVERLSISEFISLQILMSHQPSSMYGSLKSCCRIFCHDRCFPWFFCHFCLLSGFLFFLVGRFCKGLLLFISSLSISPNHQLSSFWLSFDFLLLSLLDLSLLLSHSILFFLAHAFDVFCSNLTPYNLQLYPRVLLSFVGLISIWVCLHQCTSESSFLEWHSISYLQACIWLCLCWLW